MNFVIIHLLIFWITLAQSIDWNYNWDGLDMKPFFKFNFFILFSFLFLRLNHLQYSDNYKFVHNIFLIRHGQAIESLTDKPLSLLGEKQAHLTGKRLKELNINFDGFFTSRMTRAIQTGAIIHKYLYNVTFPCKDLLLNEGEGSNASPNAFNYTKVSQMSFLGVSI